MTSEPTCLVCYRVADVPDEPPAQSTVGMCDRCGAAIWIATSSPETTMRMCIPCAMKDYINRDDIELCMTREQIADIKKHIR